MGTIEEPLQIYESYFAGKRKYNRGRLAGRDKKAVDEDKALEKLGIELAEWGSVDSPESDSELEQLGVDRSTELTMVRELSVLGSWEYTRMHLK